mmetsp:Transcript_11409/g.12525  ORF Transcript_11409/g.12525 Transcript_11409/m.12525 type:complete len:475 (-) Transcript_11409:107-1531(-)
MTVRSILLLCFCVYVLSYTPVVLKIDTVGSVAYQISKSFLSFNFDWWPRGDPGWGNAGLLNIDLNNPNLNLLAKNLSPARLRIGGSLSDFIIYEVGDNHEKCTAGHCFNMTRWHQVNDFAKAAGVKIAFGLNEKYNNRKSGEPWDTSNAEAFLNYTAAQHFDTIYGFEIGNELNHDLTPQDCAADAKALKGLLAKYWPEESTRPLIIAPDDGFDQPWLEEYVKLTVGITDVYTYHKYNGAGGNPNLHNEIHTASFVDKSNDTAQQVYSLIRQYDKKAQVWLGEGAAAYDSGQDNTTNTFSSGFYYLNALGALASNGHTGFCRQTLVGGWYELLNKTTFEPNPDYYTAYLWKHLMGDNVLSVTYNTSQDVRIYAHCSSDGNGQVALAIINLSETETFEFHIEGVEAFTPRVEYWFGAPGGNIRSKKTMLNGKILEFKDGKLPDLSGHKSSDAIPIVANPSSYGFAVLLDAKAKLC